MALSRALRGAVGRLLPQLQSGVKAQPVYAAYRHLSAAAAAGAEDDFVLAVYKEQQNQFLELEKARQSIKVPMDPSDEKAVKAYVKALDDLKAKVGIPSFGERVERLLDAAEEDSQDVRTFILETGPIGSILGVNTHDIERELLSALGKVEQSLGKPLQFSDSKGMASFLNEIKDLDSKYASVSLEQLEEELKFEEAVNSIKDIRTATESAIHAAKARDHLDFLPDPDLKSLKPQPLFA
eukprot:jgi/Chlat1/4832/Chrsp31S04870